MVKVILGIVGGLDLVRGQGAIVGVQRDDHYSLRAELLVNHLAYRRLPRCATSADSNDKRRLGLRPCLPHVLSSEELRSHVRRRRRQGDEIVCRLAILLAITIIRYKIIFNNI